MTPIQSHVQVLHGDLPRDFYEAALGTGLVAWDIETSGLDWSSDSIGTCQIATETDIAIVVMEGVREPKFLCALLEDDQVQKVFHHAPFDLRFMVAQWDVNPHNVACTKVASKILNPELQNGDHSLMPVLKRHLGVDISKDQQVSNWLASDLSPEQIRYAAGDVANLVRLHKVLTAKCERAGLTGLLVESFSYLPTRVRLDLRGSGDVFAY
jgi:ribonuclease D